jgi:general secretion pathway protein D
MLRNRFTICVIALLAADRAPSLFAQNTGAPQTQEAPAQGQQPPAPRVVPAPPQTTPQAQPQSTPEAGSVPTQQPAPGPTPQGAPQPGTPVPPAGQVPAPQAAPERKLLPPPAVPSGGMVSLNFNRADLVEIIHIIAQHLRLTYTIDPEVKGTVTINSAEPLRTEDLLPIFHQLLRMNGAVAVKTGNLYNIMPIKEGKGLARPMGQNKEDSFALQIVPVRFFSVAEMKRVLTPFLQPGGEIVENPRGNFLIIMDLPSNIQRLMEIADLIDVQVFAGTRMEIYQPKIASAEDLAQEMTKVMQSFASSAPQPDSFTAEFIALPRINQLLVISHSEAAWTYAKRWLDRIDVITEGPGRRIFIYPVENGKADDLANVLNQALGQPATAIKSSTQTLQDLHRFSPSSGTGGTAQPGTRSPTSTGMGIQQSSPFGAYAAVPVPGQPVAPGTPAPVTPPAPGAPRPPAPGPQAPRPEEQLRIVADPATNSLIVYGTAQEFQNIKNILKDLDIVPRQVLLDVLIVEVTLTDNQSLGIDYEILENRPATIFGQKFPSAGALRSLGSTLFPSGGQFGAGATAVVGSGDLRAIINALQSDSRVKVLSSPSVLAADNRPARIQVGSQEPVATGSVSTPITTTGTGTATSFATSATIQYQNTGRIVTIIPQVNSQGLVNLQILAEVSQINPNAAVTLGTSGSFPSFDIRQAETTAVVQDGDSLAIGGIIADNRSRSRTGIPYLMDLPVIGRFFGTTSDQLTRTELIMLITPHVIRNRDQSQQITEDFKKSLSAVRNELDRMAREREKLQQRPLLEQKPTLPGPSGDVVPAPNPPAPAPAPSSVPAGPGASVAPVRKISLASKTPPNDAVKGLPSAAGLQVQTPAPGGSTISVEVENPRPAEVPQVNPQHAYALSVTRHPEKTSASAIPKPVSAKEELKSAQQWTVQVASMARQKDAENLADVLRNRGYDVYVMAVNVDGKTWHRIRVGQSLTRADASKLQKTLQISEKFESSYIISR